MGLGEKQDAQPDFGRDGLARPWMPAPKSREKAQTTKLLLHLVFCALESLYGPLKASTAPAWFQWGVPRWWCCSPWHISPGRGDLSPWQLSHRDRGTGPGEQLGLGSWVKAEEDLFHKKDNECPREEKREL